MPAEITVTGGTVSETAFDYISYVVALSEPESEPVSVQYRLLAGTADDTDLRYNTTSNNNRGTITFLPGETTATVQIEAVSDTIDESDEFVVLELFHPSSNAAFALNQPVLRSVGIILDDDGITSNLAVIVLDPVVVEGDDGTVMAQFEVALSRPAQTPVTLDYATADISAKAELDYIATSGQLHFDVGQQSKTVSVPVIGDTIPELVEAFALIVSPHTGEMLDIQSAAGMARLLDTDTSSMSEISVQGGVATEGSQTHLRYIVSLSQPATDFVSVSYRLLPGTADDDDIRQTTTSAFNSGTVIFQPGETTKSIQIELVGDSHDEQDETLTLELFDPIGAASFAEGMATLQSAAFILDDDGAGSNIVVAVSSPVLVEADGGQSFAQFDVLLSRPSNTSIMLEYETKDITAKASADYIATSGSLTYAPGQVTHSVTVPIIGDTLGEAAETFALVVAPTPAIAGTVGQALILDTDQSELPEISIHGGSTLEGAFHHIRYVVSLSEPSLETVWLSYRTLPMTGGDLDLRYQTTTDATNGTLIFSPGETTKSILVEPKGDGLDERDEAVLIELFNPSANAVFAGDAAPVLRSVGTIQDDDGAGANLSLHVIAPVVTETDIGETEATFEIVLSRPAPESLSVSYHTSDITAMAGQDYTETSGTVTFAAGQTHHAITVPVLGDTAGEFVETFGLTLTPSSEIISGTTAVATLLDTDTNPLPEVSIKGYHTVEGDFSFLRYVVSLSETAQTEVTVDWATVEGSAQVQDLRHGLISGTLTFAPGERSHSIFVETASDTLDEQDESLFMRLTNPVNAAFGLEVSELYATAFVRDDDGTSDNTAVTATRTQLTETGATFTDYQIEVSLSRPDTSFLSFDAALLSGSAVDGTDFALMDSMVTFAPGQTNASINVRVFGDALIETEETAELVLTPSTGFAYSGDIQSTTITVADGPSLQMPTDDPDDLVGTLGNDVIHLRGGDDRFLGIAGNDVVQGGMGDDIIDGGFGFDTASYLGATDAVSVYLKYTGADVGGGQGSDTLIDIENLTGSDHDDRLTGDETDNVLTGWLGNDVLTGKGGRDTFFGGDGDDRMRGDAEVDEMHGGDGSDIAIGLDGNDIIDGGAGNDFLYGGRASDQIAGGDGNDVLRGNRGADTMTGGHGTDDLRGGGGADDIFGDEDADVLFGGNGADRLDGGSGDDTLTGGVGAGVDDAASDIFVFSSTADGSGGFDRIKDFEDGLDLLDLSSFHFDDFASDVQPLAQDRTGGLRIGFGGGDTLFLEGLTLAEFDASDIIL